MAHPPAQSEPPEAGPALSRAVPGLAGRLGRREKDVSGDPSPIEQPGGGRKKRPSLLKRMERYVSAVLKLGRTYGTVKETTKYLGGHDMRIDGMFEDIATLRDRQNRDGERLAEAEAGIKENGEIGALGDRLDALGDRLDQQLAKTTDETSISIDHLRTEITEATGEFRHSLALGGAEQAGLSRAYSDLSRRLDLMRAGEGGLPVPAPEPTGLDALMESFYARLEDRYRGAREEIKRRLVQYLPEAEAAAERTGKPILDLGCGRGEWIELLGERGVAATGVDLNEMQLREARALDLDVHLGDACRFLADAPDGSYAMITAHHLAEHLPFKTLVWITREALRVLAPGGVLLYETPNIGNVVVGASSFHVDPTHVQPLPAAVLTTLFDTVGFHPVESRLLHPHAKYDELVREDRLDSEIAGLLFGPQDLAVLGTKPREAD